MAVSYVVKRGDNLSRIAARYGMTWPQLYRYDGGTGIPNSSRLRSGDPDLIFPEEVLLVPGQPQPAADRSEAHRVPAIAMIEKYRVRTGDTLESIARANGMTWQELARFNWETDVPSEINDHLRREVGSTHRTRDGRNYIFDDSDDPGIVYIPRSWSQDGLTTDAEHTIRVRLMPPGEQRLIIRLLDGGENPRPGVSYRLEVGDRVFETQTDDQGRIDHVIPANAVQGVLTVDGQTIPLAINTLPPIEEPAGVRERLRNLGYSINSLETDVQAAMRGAVAAFQRAHESELRVTGEVDETTRAKLKQVYGH